MFAITGYKSRFENRTEIICCVGVLLYCVLYCSNGGTLFCLWHYLVEPTPPPPPPQQQLLKENVAVDAEVDAEVAEQ